MTWDDEDESDKQEDGEEDSDEEDDDGEDDNEEDDDQDGSEEEEEGGGISEAAAFDKSEDDVKATGGVFLSLVRDAINNTKKGVESKKLAEQNLVLETRSDTKTVFRDIIIAEWICLGIHDGMR